MVEFVNSFRYFFFVGQSSLEDFECREVDFNFRGFDSVDMWMVIVIEGVINEFVGVNDFFVSLMVQLCSYFGKILCVGFDS